MLSKRVNGKFRLLVAAGIFGLAFWAGCGSTSKKSPANQGLAKPALKLPLLPISKDWRFTTDPEKQGERKQYFKTNFDDSDWTVLKEYDFWSGDYTGVGWYRQTINPPADIADKKHLYLLFGAVDEEAFVYINGEYAFERSVKSTGQGSEVLWNQPFLHDVKGLIRPGQPNVIVVKVHNIARAGGIWQPVYLFPTDEEWTAQAIFVENFWKEHRVLQADGKGGFVVHPARYQFVPRFGEVKVVPLGLAIMDNGEILLMGVARTGVGPSVYGETVQAFSSDGGATWSDFEAVGYGPCCGLTWLGGGSLFRAGDDIEEGPGLYFSHDYGRTWTERVPPPKAPNGMSWGNEGNVLVDYDADGRALLLGWTCAHRSENVEGMSRGSLSSSFVCWSRDGGRTWGDYSYPEQWNWTDTLEGQTWERSCSEGAMVRAANGWIVVAKRMETPPRFLKYHYDSFQGTGVSISKDNGKTWTPIRHVFEPGRHHANLIRLPNDDLVLTAVRRLDTRDGKLASYRLGCDALVSHDNGLTWKEDQMYILDDWPHIHHKDLGAVTWLETGDMWYGCACGHQSSISVGDGSVLTVYGHYIYGGVMIRWRP